jgi:tRNA (mo5U34)-methyltransferase
MIENYSSFIKNLEKTSLNEWIPKLEKQITHAFSPKTNGHYDRWNQAWELLPNAKPSVIHLNQSTLKIGTCADLTPEENKKLHNILMSFHPWRKGPFSFFGTEVDTEWRSDFKWDRVSSHIKPLKDGMILDIGCGSGYHCWRMLSQEPKLIFGIDPFLAFVWQYLVANKYIKSDRCAVLPLGIDSIPSILPAFSTIFSMGVFYHRKDPIGHLIQIKNLLRPKGEVVLETIVIKGGEQDILVPKDRYAKMRNVWFIPSSEAMRMWLKKCGFRKVRVVNETVTSFEEQRKTEWMKFESLKDFLDPKDITKTIEGYPSPRRAIFIAEKP